jgi:predicted negative regulator of RcsB-dependent stress response
MARKITQKELKQDEFVDAAVDFGKWLEDNWPKVLRWVIVVAVLAVAIISWTAYSRHNQELAESRLSAILATYDRLETEGFTDTAKLESVLTDLDEVAGSAGGASSSVAHLYRGTGLLQLERNDEAEQELQKAISRADKGSTLYATANSVLANVFEATGRTDEAVALLDKMLDSAGDSSQVPKDQVLLQTGMICERAGRTEEARERWERVTDEYANSVAAGEARRLLTQ